MLLGMGSSLWQTLQHIIDTNNPKPPSRIASDWMNRETHQLLKLSLRCWKFRNITIHGANAKECRQKALERARNTITSLYTNPPTLASQFRPITDVPPTQRLRLSLPAVEHWIALVEHQVKVSVHNLKVLLKQHRPIPEHFATMEKDTSQQTARLRQSPSRDSPRRAHSRKVQEDVKAMRLRLYRSIAPTHARIATPRAATSSTSQLVSPTSRRLRYPIPRRHPP